MLNGKCRDIIIKKVKIKIFVEQVNTTTITNLEIRKKNHRPLETKLKYKKYKKYKNYN